MASNKAVPGKSERTRRQAAMPLREPQRLSMEKDLAVARRALYRALGTAERGAYFGIEDALHSIIVDTAALMDCVMRGKEVPEKLER